MEAQPRSCPRAYSCRACARLTLSTWAPVDRYGENPGCGAGGSEKLCACSETARDFPKCTVGDVSGRSSERRWNSSCPPFRESDAATRSSPRYLLVANRSAFEADGTGAYSIGRLVQVLIGPFPGARQLSGELQSPVAHRQRECGLPSWPAFRPRTLVVSYSSAVGGLGGGPFKEDVGLIADSAPDTNGPDFLVLDGTSKMVVVPLEHSGPTSGTPEQEYALLAGNVDHHFVHRKGASLAKRFDAAGHTSLPPLDCGPISRGSGYVAHRRRRGPRRSVSGQSSSPRSS